MTSNALRELELRSIALVAKTRLVLEAMTTEFGASEVDVLVEQQREAFNDFAMQCDPHAALEPSTRANIDTVMQLEEEIVVAVENQRVSLVAQGRAISARIDVARAFQSRMPEPPQFVTRRV